jgi:hypothetical protein
MELNLMNSMFGIEFLSGLSALVFSLAFPPGALPQAGMIPGPPALPLFPDIGHLTSINFFVS